MQGNLRGLAHVPPSHQVSRSSPCQTSTSQRQCTATQQLFGSGAHSQAAKRSGGAAPEALARATQEADSSHDRLRRASHAQASTSGSSGPTAPIARSSRRQSYAGAPAARMSGLQAPSQKARYSVLFDLGSVLCPAHSVHRLAVAVRTIVVSVRPLQDARSPPRERNTGAGQRSESGSQRTGPPQPDSAARQPQPRGGRNTWSSPAKRPLKLQPSPAQNLAAAILERLLLEPEPKQYPGTQQQSEAERLAAETRLADDLLGIIPPPPGDHSPVEEVSEGDSDDGETAQLPGKLGSLAAGSDSEEDVPGIERFNNVSRCTALELDSSGMSVLLKELAAQVRCRSHIAAMDAVQIPVSYYVSYGLLDTASPWQKWVL